MILFFKEADKYKEEEIILKGYERKDETTNAGKQLLSNFRKSYMDVKKC